VLNTAKRAGLGDGKLMVLIQVGLSLLSLNFEVCLSFATGRSKLFAKQE